jgi:hypothetical protein
MQAGGDNKNWTLLSPGHGGESIRALSAHVVADENGGRWENGSSRDSDRWGGAVGTEAALWARLRSETGLV